MPVVLPLVTRGQVRAAYATVLVEGGHYDLARNELELAHRERVSRSTNASVTAKAIAAAECLLYYRTARWDDLITSTATLTSAKDTDELEQVIAALGNALGGAALAHLGSHGAGQTKLKYAIAANFSAVTPKLDALARKGLVFTNLYATGTRTVRGLDALTLGIPPIPGQAIVRRPGNEHLATLGEILHHQGYESLFIYGGYGYFDNMNAYYASNDYRVVDRTDFPKASVGFANIWGVADEYLFDNSLTQLDKVYATGKPFLAQIMTTSNHRPYTYPDGRIDIPSPGHREGTVKYTD